MQPHLGEGFELFGLIVAHISFRAV
jgi:hypothetical protein